MLQKFFYSPFNFGNTSNSYYFIDLTSIKRQLIYLKNIRFILVEHFKKLKLEWSPFTNTEQLRIEDDQLRTSNINSTEDEKSMWFSNKSTNKTNCNLEYSRKSNEKKLDYRSIESKIKKNPILKIQMREI